jgi:hypothetical protein
MSVDGAASRRFHGKEAFIACHSVAGGFWPAGYPPPQSGLCFAILSGDARPNQNSDRIE